MLPQLEPVLILPFHLFATHTDINKIETKPKKRYLIATCRVVTESICVSSYLVSGGLY